MIIKYFGFNLLMSLKLCKISPVDLDVVFLIIFFF